MARYSVCGIDCDACEVGRTNGCPGCRESDGNIFWGACDLYACNAKKNQAHCGKCSEFPCAMLCEWASSENTERIDNLKKL